MNIKNSATLVISILILSLGPNVFANDVLYGSDTNTKTLYTIDTSNATSTQVGSFGVDGYMAGLAYDSVNDIMYGTTTVTDILYSINYTTASATPIGNLGAELMHGLAFDNSSELLYGAFGREQGDGLYQIDVNSGSSTLIGDIGHFYNDLRDTVHGLAIHPQTNELYGVIGGPSDLSALVKIDKSTGQGTLLHEYGIENLAGLAFLSDGTLYANDNWSGNLYTLDIADGSTELIGNTGIGNLLGLAVVPEPATLILFGLGSLILRKRKA